VREHAPGPFDEEIPRLARAPALWFVVSGNPAIVLAIVWNMTVKPGTARAIGAVAVGYAVGLGAALVSTRGDRGLATRPRGVRRSSRGS
jgi:hypothetical protein